MKIIIKRDGAKACELTLKRLGGTDYEIAYLITFPAFRGQGLARQAMDRAEALADQKGWTLLGFPDTAKDGTLNDAQMKAWLKRRGYSFAWYDFGKNSFTYGANKRVWFRNPVPQMVTAKAA
jgi:GNAT superfamily N-acetyltransferase